MKVVSFCGRVGLFKSFAILFLLSTSTAFACDVTDNVGAPTTQVPGISICRSGYALLYRPEYKSAFWSAEHILAEDVEGKLDRKNAFQDDPDVPDHLEAQLEDYFKSGYSRGHLAPVGDFRRNEQEAEESFYLTNMVPQVQKCNNAGVWSQIEDIVRDWAIHYSQIYVVTGPIYTGEPRFIGDGVRVPDAMFKVIWNPVLRQTLTFVVPNVELCKRKPRQFLASMADVEQITGIKFFPKILAYESDALWP